MRGRAAGCGCRAWRGTARRLRPSILFGQSAAFSGPVQELGRNMRLGMQAAFREVNEQGGVHGRRLELVVTRRRVRTGSRHRQHPPVDRGRAGFRADPVPLAPQPRARPFPLPRMPVSPTSLPSRVVVFSATPSGTAWSTCAPPTIRKPRKSSPA